MRLFHTTQHLLQYRVEPVYLKNGFGIGVTRMGLEARLI
jgi:hypothetical protein